MLKQMLACCKVYVSESRNRAALESIERAANLFPEAPIVNKFENETYNRVGYTLVSKLVPCCTLKSAVFEMVKAAFLSIDLEMHTGTILGLVLWTTFVSIPWLVLLWMMLQGLQNLWLLMLARGFKICSLET
ncbi:glutamate formimidoyltransferase-like isoform X1 [Olea europaea subsp. europaea]|uniref:Glutamate formimidoyltransferase-like isoform X1 n=1 Tax=Olea europaea subsp. europaea TaxID=158383 RepID=A0A8S0RZ78_OLEEU|nr:glutamate formimidoyltransferase-like isoform X1 [Olea europaea subsp. europaea]